jgi:hypothetical protein
MMMNVKKYCFQKYGRKKIANAKNSRGDIFRPQHALLWNPRLYKPLADDKLEVNCERNVEKIVFASV